MAHFFLSEGLDGCVPGALVTLRGAEAKHAASVSRVRPGEQLLVGDGAGVTVLGVVESAQPAEVSVRVTECRRTPPPPRRIILVQALAKGGRDESAVQAATELGVDQVIPWQAERSVSRWQGAKIVTGVERWRSIVREATKQSQRAWLPEVAELADSKHLAGLAGGSRMLVLEPTADAKLSQIGLSEISVSESVPASSDTRDVVVVVGPEGGVSPAELQLFVRAGAELVRLGDSVLRTSTAGPAAIAVLNVRFGRW